MKWTRRGRVPAGRGGRGRLAIPAPAAALARSLDSLPRGWPPLPTVGAVNMAAAAASPASATLHSLHPQRKREEGGGVHKSTTYKHYSFLMVAPLGAADQRCPMVPQFTNATQPFLKTLVDRFV